VLDRGKAELLRTNVLPAEAKAGLQGAKLALAESKLGLSKANFGL
jgi:hypothetical protein